MVMTHSVIKENICKITFLCRRTQFYPTGSLIRCFAASVCSDCVCCSGNMKVSDSVQWRTLRTGVSHHTHSQRTLLFHFTVTSENGLTEKLQPVNWNCHPALKLTIVLIASRLLYCLIQKENSQFSLSCSLQETSICYWIIPSVLRESDGKKSPVVPKLFVILILRAIEASDNNSWMYSYHNICRRKPKYCNTGHPMCSQTVYNCPTNSPKPQDFIFCQKWHRKAVNPDN